MTASQQSVAVLVQDEKLGRNRRHQLHTLERYIDRGSCVCGCRSSFMRRLKARINR